MKRYLAFAVAAVVAMLFVLPLGAGASSDKRFVISWHGGLAGETSGTGTFSIGGSLSDSGTFETSFATTPGRGTCFRVTGDTVYTAPDGTLAEHYSGQSCASSETDPRATFDGRFEITGGTGAFAGVSGKGTITSLADFENGTFTGVHDGKVHRAH